MSTPVNLNAYNNEHFRLSFDMTAWASAYNLTTAAWRMQIRPTAENQLVELEMSTANGKATYGAPVVVFQANTSDVQTFTGDHAWDFGFTPSGSDFVRCAGGTITFNQGVTR